jgi:hypothetical protein
MMKDERQKWKGVQAKHVRHGVESGAVVAPTAPRHLPTFEQNQEILQSKLTTFACTRGK